MLRQVPPIRAGNAMESSAKTLTLVTGGAGFIGSHLVEYLRGLGRRVLIIDDLSTGRRRNVEHLLGDGCRLIQARVSEALRGPEAVLAGVGRV